MVVVAGIPGSGKPTLAAQLGGSLGLSGISKDAIKEALMDTLGTGDIDWVAKASDEDYRAALDIGLQSTVTEHSIADVIRQARRVVEGISETLDVLIDQRARQAART